MLSGRNTWEFLVNQEKWLVSENTGVVQGCKTNVLWLSEAILYHLALFFISNVKSAQKSGIIGIQSNTVAGFGKLN